VRRGLVCLALAFAAVSCGGPAVAPERDLPAPGLIDAALAAVHANGLALAVIDDGQVAYTRSLGKRNGQNEPLQSDTVMYGASLTKAVFAYTVMQWVDEGLVDLDVPIHRLLKPPLPAPWRDIEGDARWRRLTPRILLSHRAGFANFAFLEPDGKLRFHFEPGSRYAYSGEGLQLLQFALERGLGLDVGAEMQRRVFDRFGMQRSGMTWRPSFADNLADGFTASGALQPHSRRSRVRVAGSMDTTLDDFARFAAGFMRGEGLSQAARAAMLAAQGPITTARQFPTLLPELPPPQRRPDLASGLGVILFDGPQGPGFYKGGHDDATANTWVCVERRRRCVVLLSNDVRAEAAFPGLVAFILGPTGVPWDWEYGP
jgi:CubicO group peptidase (beta-lactamase class C family)